MKALSATMSGMCVKVDATCSSTVRLFSMSCKYVRFCMSLSDERKPAKSKTSSPKIVATPSMSFA